MLKHKDRNRNLAFYVCLGTAFGLMTFLFWAQSVRLHDGYQSDMYAHITKALANRGTGYSLEGKLVVLCNWLCGGSNIGFAALLAFLVCMTAVSVGFLMRELDSDGSPTAQDSSKGNWIGLWSVFCAPLVIPYIWFWFYRNTMNINAWHNSTYMEMRLFSVLALMFYYRIEKKMLGGQKTGLKNWIGFALTLMIATWFKPSFFVGFAPVMFIWLMVDMYRYRKESDRLKTYFIHGCAVIPALLMIAIQYWKLYGSREDVSLALGGNIQDHTLYAIRVGLFLIIPLIIFVKNRKNVMADYRNGNRAYFQMWTLWAFELLYHLALSEVGRSGGNFGWGVRIGNYLIMIFSVRLYWQNVLDFAQRDSVEKQKSLGERIYLWGVGFALMWELVWGLYYFGHLLTGASYSI